MKHNSLGNTTTTVSEVCLGSMTWGLQNNQADADQQINFAIEQGVNFIDTAEMYAVPPSPETYGKTETIIGNWLERNSEKRESLIIASKIAGVGLPWVREGAPITAESIKTALDGSLKRLQTDYIDLYQLHWPNRMSPHFSNHWPNQVKFSDTDSEVEREQMHEILDALDEAIKAGKIRHCGLSNETPWGLSAYLSLSKEFSLPRMVSMQNEFSLLHSKDWPYMLETSVREDVSYLPWSPIAGGMLSGKYANCAIPEGSRWSISQRNGIFRNTEQAHSAVAEYSAIAKSMGITTAQLALAWCKQIDGVTSTIIGATTKQQLAEDIAAFSITLTDEQLEKVGAVLRNYPSPF
jgi:aryl-alcohol dehydrogenase-like predicted oxidoreductase